MKRCCIFTKNKQSRTQSQLPFVYSYIDSTKEYCCKYFKTSNALGYPDVVNHAYVIVEISVEFGACW